MVRPMQIIHVSSESFSIIPLAIGLFVSVSLLVALCAKHARHVPKKYTSKTSDPHTAKAPSASPSQTPKQLITTISHKAVMINAKKSSSGQEYSDQGVRRNNKGDEESGLWQKAILMGEKCQPPDFSGVIYYDYAGNQVSEMPKSPRATSMSPLKSFNLQKNKNSMY